MTTAEKIKCFEIDKLQNHPANINRDHMTICAFFQDDAQWAAHRNKLRAAADTYNAAR